MTGEEMERVIEFLLQSQAAHDARLDKLTTLVAETGRQLQAYAETQSEFIQIVTHTMTGLADRITGLADAQARTERIVADTNARLDRLAGIVEQHLAGHS